MSSWVAGGNREREVASEMGETGESTVTATPVVLMGTEFVPESEGRIDVRSQGFNYGASVFEGIRAYWNAGHRQLYVVRLPEHVERLARSGHVLGIDLPGDTDAVVRLLSDLLRRNRYREDVYLRPIAYKGVPRQLGVTLTDAPSLFTAYSFVLGEYLPRDRAIRATVSAWQRVSDNAIPARCKVGGAYVNPAIAKTEAVARGFDECIMLTGAGTAAEASTSNLFLLYGDELVTPSVTEDILVGITRACVLELAAAELNLAVVERPVDRTELYQADEVFLCGTGAEVVAVGEIDGRVIGAGDRGPVARRLGELYAEAARGNSERYSPGWCTPVYDERDEEWLGGVPIAAADGAQVRTA
jgi:branched-chain amino acid aminotransferase